ncbi:delta-sarcoglycan [Nephila pilipes]|uniref:Delta-sarcoglycan n=1 Tax=Nephila pilipes TaxID=299642 RepID=A0A8X6NIQ1_NEPPI|nr:delta-sarcoglycan [Nephila pilipes]
MLLSDSKRLGNPIRLHPALRTFYPGRRASGKAASFNRGKMATKTLTVPVAPGSSCNGELNPSDQIQLTVVYPQGGIIGWKKKTLYLLLILLVSVVIINLTLILWIIKILDLTSEGPGKMRISEKGLRLDSDAEFLDTLSGKQIWALPSQSLKIESAGNVTMKAHNNRGFITNTLSIGEAGFQAVGNYFLIRGTTGNVLLQVDPHEMVVSANHMVVSDSGGLRLDGSLETPLVRGGATKDLRAPTYFRISPHHVSLREFSGYPLRKKNCILSTILAAEKVFLESYANIETRQTLKKKNTGEKRGKKALQLQSEI